MFYLSTFHLPIFSTFLFVIAQVIAKVKDYPQICDTWVVSSGILMHHNQQLFQPPIGDLGVSGVPLISPPGSNFMGIYESVTIMEIQSILKELFNIVKQ